MVIRMEDRESILKKMSLGDVLDYSIELYKSNFVQLTLLSLVGYMPIVLLSAYISGNLLAEQVNIFKGLFSNFGNPGFNPGILNEGNLGSTYMVYTMLSYVVQLLALVFSFTVQLAMEAAIIKIIYSHAVQGTPAKAFPEFKAGFKKLGHMILNKVVYWIIIGSIYLVAVILIALIMVAVILALVGINGPGNNLSTPVIVTLVVLGILILLGIIFVTAFFAMRLLFGKHIIVLENGDFGKSLSRSWHLTKGNFWHIALSLLIGAVLLYFLPVIFTASSFALNAMGKGLFVLGFISSQVLSSLIYPFLWTIITVIFINLKIKKEGLDLEVKVDKLLAAQKSLKAPDETGETTDA